MFRRIGWSPTIALSWLWGLGFFYSFQITLTNGWLAFIAFALPNAFGLFAFGWILGDPRHDAAAIFQSVQRRYASLFLSCQVLAVAITIFASVAYLFIPLFGSRSLPLVAAFVLLATAIGRFATMRRLKILHAGYLALGLAATAVLLIGLVRLAPSHVVVAAAFDGRFLGLMVPTLVGFLLGPWTDIQHWQRVVAIQNEGGSIRRAYSGGALLFLVLISINALIAIAAGPVLTFTTSDGLKGMQAAVAGAVSASGGGALTIAYVVWAGVAVASTLDSFYFATRWLLRSTMSNSKHSRIAFLPVGILTSPSWFLMTALLVALFMIEANMAMIYLMMPFASLMAGAAACLVCESVGGRPRYNGTLCAAVGLVSFLLLARGYARGEPIVMDFAPIVGLIGAFPAIRDLFMHRGAPATPVPSTPMGRTANVSNVIQAEAEPG